MKYKAKVAAVMVSLGLSCVPVTANASSAQDAPGSIGVSQEGQAEGDTLAFFRDLVVVPGDKFSNTVDISNDGEGDGIARAWVKNPKSLFDDYDLNHEFFTQLMYSYDFNGSVGSGTLGDLISKTPQEGLFLGESRVSVGQSVPLSMQINYPEGSSQRPPNGGNLGATFDILIRMKGTLDTDGIVAKNIVGVYIDKNNDGVVNVGDIVSWEVTILNEDTNLLTDISTTTTINGREVTLNCPKAELLGKESMLCHVSVPLTQEDINIGYQNITVSANSKNELGDEVKSSEAKARAELPESKAVAIKDNTKPVVLAEEKPATGDINSGEVSANESLATLGYGILIFGLGGTATLYARRLRLARD